VTGPRSFTAAAALVVAAAVAPPGAPASAAPQVSRARVGAESQAPTAPGAPSRSPEAPANWVRRVATHVVRFKPTHAYAHGTVVLAFVVDRRGRLLDARISRSSRVQVLDVLAMAMILNANPVPPPPDALQGDRFPFALPVRFHVSPRGGIR